MFWIRIKKNGSFIARMQKMQKRIYYKGKLIRNMADKLTVHRCLAIHRNCDSVENMKKVIWATYCYYSLTDEKP